MFNNCGTTMAMPMMPMAPAYGNNCCGNGNGGFGDENGWWVLIILFALFGGWGNRGYGNNGNGSGETVVVVPPNGGYGMGNTNFGFAEAAVQRGFDNSAVITKLDGINNGLCSLGYDQLAQMNGINANITQASFGLQQSINDNTVAGMQNTNAIQAQIAQCCCKEEAAIKDLAYNMATENCALRQEVHQTGDAIIQSQNWGFRNLQDTINAGFANIERQADQRYIRELEAKLNACDRDRALQDTADRILGVTNPRAVPAYPSCNPNGVGNWAPSVLSNGCYCNQNTCCG